MTLPALSALQEGLLAARRAGGPVDAHARALRISGRIDPDSLAAAVREVCAATPVLSAFDVEPSISVVELTGDEACIGVLRVDRDRAPDLTGDPLVRFHLLSTGADELVLGVVADPLALDLRSVYSVLGAVMQAYFGRFRPDGRGFDGVAALDPVGSQKARSARRARWTRRLTAWDRATPEDGPTPVTHSETDELRLDAARWEALTKVGDSGGNPGWLALLALLIWWYRVHTRPDRPAVFTGSLDLRDYLGIDAVVGPLTDRSVIEVELDGFATMSFRDLVRRAHVGLLDSVVHHLPYAELLALGPQAGVPQPQRLWDVGLHYCRLPPASSYTRGEETLARRGLSIELFRESDLVAAVPGQTSRAHTAMDVHVAEAGDGMALVLNFDPGAVSTTEVAALLRGVDLVIDSVTDDPDAPLSAIDKEGTA